MSPSYGSAVRCRPAVLADLHPLESASRRMSPGAHALTLERVSSPQSASLSKGEERMRYAEVTTRATRVEVAGRRFLVDQGPSMADSRGRQR